ncbi:MAG TPA: hypothetical protein VMX75_03355, partial [Spirochaetia bacterium]|nr:hypothetical protein [Spirochaetia bacterium]
MRTIRFFLLSGFFLFLFSALLFGLDFGGVIDNSTGIDYMDEATLQQSDKLSLWFNGGMGANVDFYARGSFKYINEKPELRLNLDLLRLNGAFATEEGGPPNFSFSFGRFNIADFTNYVFEHTADGLLLGFRFPAARIRTFFGFTGLLFKHSSDILISTLDAYDSVNDDVLLAPWRVVGLVDVTFQELFLRQTLTVSFLFQEDVRNADDLIEVGEEQPVAGGGHVDTQYLGLGLSGAILSNLYYNAFFYLAPGRTLSYLADSKSATGYSYQYDSILSYMAGGGVSLFFREFLFSRIALNFLLTSGDEDAAAFTEGNTRDYSTVFI